MLRKFIIINNNMSAQRSASNVHIRRYRGSINFPTRKQTIDKTS